MTRPIYYERTYLHLVPKARHSFQAWGRDRLVQIIAELEALRADKARLLRQCTKIARCECCRVLKTVTIQEGGWYFCNRCAESAQGATA